MVMPHGTRRRPSGNGSARRHPDRTTPRRAAAPEAQVRGLDRAHHLRAVTLQLRMPGAVRLGAEDVPPTLLGQIDRTTIDIEHPSQPNGSRPSRTSLLNATV